MQQRKLPPPPARYFPKLLILEMSAALMSSQKASNLTGALKFDFPFPNESTAHAIFHCIKMC